MVEPTSDDPVEVAFGVGMGEQGGEDLLARLEELTVRYPQG